MAWSWTRRVSGSGAIGGVLGALMACGAGPALARPGAMAAAAPDTCGPAIALAELQVPLPAKLLGTIALVESGRADPGAGHTVPWPWTITAAGVGHYYPTKAAAIAAAAEFLAQGVRSIDVGCLQINLFYHPAAFASLDQAFDPAANARYGARFLDALYRQTGNWPRAAAAYHSQTPDIGQGYESRVMAIWPLAWRFPDASLQARRAPATDVDYRTLTPEFAARAREMAADRAQLQARFGPATAAAEAPRHAPRTARFGGQETVGMGAPSDRRPLG